MRIWARQSIPGAVEMEAGISEYCILNITGIDYPGNVVRILRRYSPEYLCELFPQILLESYGTQDMNRGAEKRVIGIHNLNLLHS